jgi:hypothetical protein
MPEFYGCVRKIYRLQRILELWRESIHEKRSHIVLSDRNRRPHAEARKLSHGVLYKIYRAEYPPKAPVISRTS